MKPKLIIGGASKAGTTALYYYLLQHPDICLSAKKELHYFSREWLQKYIGGPGDRYVAKEIPKTIEEYYSSFGESNSRSKIAIDISPSYLYHYGSAANIKKNLGDVKIVFILRNPAEKIFSQYVHLVSEGREKLSFLKALEAEDYRVKQGYSDIWLYKRSGYYATSINSYYKLIGKKNVKVFYYEELAEDPYGVLKKICRFSGINENYQFERVSEVNKTGLPKSNIISRAIAPNLFTYLMRRILPNWAGRAVRNKLKEWNLGRKPRLDDETYSALISLYTEDIRNLELLVGKKSDWLDRTKIRHQESK